MGIGGHGHFSYFCNYWGGGAWGGVVQGGNKPLSGHTSESESLGAHSLAVTGDQASCAHKSFSKEPGALWVTEELGLHSALQEHAVLRELKITVWKPTVLCWEAALGKAKPSSGSWGFREREQCSRPWRTRAWKFPPHGTRRSCTYRGGELGGEGRDGRPWEDLLDQERALEPCGEATGGQKAGIWGSEREDKA